MTFEITKSGFYSIWINGKMFSAVALNIRNAIISDLNDNKLKSIKSYFRLQVTGFKQGRTLLKYYYLKKGTYTFKVVKEQEDALGIFSKRLLRKDLYNLTTDFNYELRQTLPEFLFPLIIIGIILPIVTLLEQLQ